MRNDAPIFEKLLLKVWHYIKILFYYMANAISVPSIGNAQLALSNIVVAHRGELGGRTYDMI